MDHCKDFIKTEFPSIDIEMFQYIEGNILVTCAYLICLKYYMYNSIKKLYVLYSFLSMHIDGQVFYKMELKTSMILKIYLKQLVKYYRK